MSVKFIGSAFISFRFRRQERLPLLQELKGPEAA